MERERVTVIRQRHLKGRASEDRDGEKESEGEGEVTEMERGSRGREIKKRRERQGETD